MARETEETYGRPGAADREPRAAGAEPMLERREGAARPANGRTTTARAANGGAANGRAGNGRAAHEAGFRTDDGVHREPVVEPGANGRSARRPAAAPVQEPSLGTLLSQLASDAGRLVQDEVQLAKSEMRQTVTAYTKDATKIAIGAGVAIVGALWLTAFLVFGLAVLIANLWLSALIVGSLFLIVGAIMASSALKDAKKHSLKPEQTLTTLRADQAWAKRESREFKRDLVA